ncbi:actin-related protein 10, partial [Tremellales sp. Uapishka_1]
MESPARPKPDTSAAVFVTPTKRATFSTSEAGPSRARPAGASPAYSSRRHSLYGIEHRVIIDPGSRIWKVGFSGEPDPRAVFWANEDPDSELWDFDLAALGNEDRIEGDRLVGARIVKKLREVFFKHLLTDPKSRKIIIVENTFLPTFVKDQLALALFDNLKAPSVSFTPSSLLSLAACGRVTGLVIDSGWLETSITPVFHSRPLFHLSRPTPLAGRRLHQHLRSLLLHYATYIPPPPSLGNLSDRSSAAVPPQLLTDRLLERILTEACFVGGVVIHDGTKGDQELDSDESDEARRMRLFKERYEGTSTAKDASFMVAPVRKSDMGPGSLIVPGWIRERTAEILFEHDGESEDASVPHAILNTMLKLPIDLRPIMASTLLVTGGTPSLPGFIPRLRISLLRLLLPPPSPPVSPVSPTAHTIDTQSWRNRNLQPYKPLYGLASYLAILNDPAPLDSGSSRGGTAPRWVPSLLPFVGGSLAGALKIGGEELTREGYDELAIAIGERETEEEVNEGVDMDELVPGMAVVGFASKRKRGVRDKVGIKDWSMSLVGSSDDPSSGVIVRIDLDVATARSHEKGGTDGTDALTAIVPPGPLKPTRDTFDELFAREPEFRVGYREEHGDVVGLEVQACEGARNEDGVLLLELWDTQSQ